LEFRGQRRLRLAAALKIGAADERGLDHDPIKMNRIMVWFFRWSMIFSENRHPLSRIML
jgi:hypothetical protein